MDAPYSNREIDSHFLEIKETLERIEKQTIKTNGRVSSLEEWRSYVVGAVAVLVLIGLPLLTYNLWQTVRLSEAVAKIIE